LVSTRLFVILSNDKKNINACQTEQAIFGYC